MKPFRTIAISAATPYPAADGMNPSLLCQSSTETCLNSLSPRRQHATVDRAVPIMNELNILFNNFDDRHDWLVAGHTKSSSNPGHTPPRAINEWKGFLRILSRHLGDNHYLSLGLLNRKCPLSPTPFSQLREKLPGLLAGKTFFFVDLDETMGGKSISTPHKICNSGSHNSGRFREEPAWACAFLPEEVSEQQQMMTIMMTQKFSLGSIVPQVEYWITTFHFLLPARSFSLFDWSWDRRGLKRCLSPMGAGCSLRNYWWVQGRREVFDSCWNLSFYLL